MIFASDNWSGAAPEIAAALANHTPGFRAAYGTSDLDASVEKQFCDFFEADVSVFMVATGTAANSLALAASCKPGAIAFCHSEAHMVEDECGAPEFLSSGGRLIRVSGELGKINRDSLLMEIAGYPSSFNHRGRSAMVSVTQITEVGASYSCEEISTIASIAHENDMQVHMDGARFANALANLGVSPAKMTWKSGVDLLSFGGTKNGCWCAETLIVFNKDLASELPFLRKRSGHLFSKNRFVSAQFEAYLSDNLWLELANHSNSMGQRLRDGVCDAGKARLAWETHANMTFIIAKRSVADSMMEQGARFYEIRTPRSFDGVLDDDEKIYRLVASFATTADDVDEFLELIQ